MRYISPLRYPGGKASLSDFLTDTIDLNDLRGGHYYEPYAGGAGAALRLLSEGTVSAIHINDADPRIFSFWKSALDESERFVEAIRSVPLSIDEWKRQREVCIHPENQERFDLGFSTFFMNRCNRSGVVVGAGPIGGHSQAGNWTIDVRFRREELVQRILTLQKFRDRIKVSNLDAIDFLKTTLPSGRKRNQVFVYLDPPYVEKGNRLYYNAYDERDHLKIAAYLKNQKVLRWVLSYDDSPLIKSLYHGLSINSMPITYSLQSKRLAKELIITPNDLVLPYELRHKLAV